MHSWFDALTALFAAYGVVFFIWWIITLVFARKTSVNFTFCIHSHTDQTYLKWLNFAGILPLQENGEINGTGIDDNRRNG